MEAIYESLGPMGKRVWLVISGLLGLILLAAGVFVTWLIFGALTAPVTCGDFHANKYGDVAVLTAYTGSQRSIVLPAEIEGASVVDFKGFTDESGMVEEVVIPDEMNDPVLLYLLYFPALQRYSVSDTHPTLMVRDGVLYSRDGRTLISYPQGRTGEAVIPEGVETIGPGAFFRTTASAVLLPDSLRTIADAAFGNALALRVLQLPAGVETISKDAFASEPDSCPTLRLIVPEGSAAHAYALENALPIEQVLPAQ